MAGKPIGGISGVLEELISSAPTSGQPDQQKQPSAANREPKPADTPQPPNPRPCRARLGRPLGSNVRQTSPKEKVTLRISGELIADYRDWSWETRCQLSELVECALMAYRKSRRS